MPIDKKIIDAATAASGTVTVPMQSYEHALLHVKCATGGDFDLAVTATATALSGDSAVSVVPSGTDVSDISDILLPLGPTGAESLTVAWSNLSNNTGPHTITAATGYVDGQNVNVNSTLTTDAGPRTGTLTRTVTGLQMGTPAYLDRISTSGTPFHADDVGRSIVIASSTEGNDGTYTIATYVGVADVDVTPDFAAPETGTAATATLNGTCPTPTVAPAGNLARIQGGSNWLFAADVGRTIVVSGSADGDNNGTYTITGLFDAATAIVTPDLSSTDTGGSLSVVLTLALADENIAPGEDLFAVTSGSDMFSTYDVGRDLVIASGPTAGTYEIATVVSAQSITVVEEIPVATGSVAGTVTGALTGLDFAPGGSANRIHAATAQFAEVDEGASVAVTGSTWALNGYLRLWSEGKK